MMCPEIAFLEGEEVMVQGYPGFYLVIDCGRTLVTVAQHAGDGWMTGLPLCFPHKYLTSADQCSKVRGKC